MVTVWGKLIQKNRIVKSATATDDHGDWSLLSRVKGCVEALCHELDLATPIYLAVNLSDLESFGVTRFTEDHFIEHFPYQSFEIEIIGTDEDEEASDE